MNFDIHDFRVRLNKYGFSELDTIMMMMGQDYDLRASFLELIVNGANQLIKSRIHHPTGRMHTSIRVRPHEIQVTERINKSLDSNKSNIKKYKDTIKRLEVRNEQLQNDLKKSVDEKELEDERKRNEIKFIQIDREYDVYNSIKKVRSLAIEDLKDLRTTAQNIIIKIRNETIDEIKVARDQAMMEITEKQYVINHLTNKVDVVQKAMVEMRSKSIEMCKRISNDIVNLTTTSFCTKCQKTDQIQQIIWNNHKLHSTILIEGDDSEDEEQLVIEPIHTNLSSNPELNNRISEIPLTMNMMRLDNLTGVDSWIKAHDDFKQQIQSNNPFS